MRELYAKRFENIRLFVLDPYDLIPERHDNTLKFWVNAYLFIAGWA